jgi:hypothetical protein
MSLNHSRSEYHYEQMTSQTPHEYNDYYRQYDSDKEYEEQVAPDDGYTYYHSYQNQENVHPSEQILPEKNTEPFIEYSDRHLEPASVSEFSPLKEAQVLFPQLKESTVKSYMLYKVKLVWNDKEFEVTRRFSDFQKLRNAIKKFLPFTFVLPVHRKKILVG